MDKNYVRCILFEDFRCSSYDGTDFCQSALTLPFRQWYCGFVHAMSIDVLFRLRDTADVHELEWQWEEALVEEDQKAEEEDKQLQWGAESSRSTLSRCAHWTITGQQNCVSDMATKERRTLYKKSFGHYRENVTLASGENRRHLLWTNGDTTITEVKPICRQ